MPAEPEAKRQKCQTPKEATEFIRGICNLIVNKASQDPEEPVVRLIGPDDLKAKIDLELSEAAENGSYEASLPTAVSQPEPDILRSCWRLPPNVSIILSKLECVALSSHYQLSLVGAAPTLFQSTIRRDGASSPRRGAPHCSHQHLNVTLAVSRGIRVTLCGLIQVYL